MGRRYGLGGPWVLRGVDMDLPARALVRIEGANGTGKSTLLRLLAGIDAPSEGRVTGRVPRTAYVPERFPAALPFTAAGLLVHLGRVHGLRTGEAAARAQMWLTRFGAETDARTPLAELSKGTSQKVAVAHALMADPGLLVLDEAWTGLDPVAREELDRAVAERVEAGATVVFVDHDPHRLAGSVDLAYGFDGRALTPVTVRAIRRPTGPRVRIEATGPPDTVLPPGLPGTPVLERGPEAATVRLTVPAADSDALLRTLLTAPRPWHIRHVAPAGSEPPGPGQAPERGAAPPAPAPKPGRASQRGPVPERVPAPALAPDRDAAPAPGLDSDPVSVPTFGPAPAPDVPVRARPPVRGGVPGRAAAALVRYESAHLLRSQRWLAPLLLYVAFLGVGVRSGQPVLDSLGYAAAGMVPVTAWFVRLCATQEPPAARAVVAAAVGRPRAHLCMLLAAVAWALVLGVVAASVVLLISEPAGSDGTAVPLPAAWTAGLLATVCCVLTGATVGALGTRPVLHRLGWSVVLTAMGVLLALVTSGSPAKHAVAGLVSGSLSGTVPPLGLPSAGALVIAAGAAALVCRLTSVRE
ncbi:ATP-binding cassette domain-containing protein [Streptomyces sp. NPDC048560]|uniref:ATP-binding cassette domain-containing protein n=1 Tax=Streptomyces sp. NPDC048560 TaxID=3155488 RepID=UPI00343FBB12